MLIATDNGFTGFEQGIRGIAMVKLLHKHNYEKKLFQLRRGAIAPIAPYGCATGLPRFSMVHLPPNSPSFSDMVAAAEDGL